MPKLLQSRAPSFVYEDLYSGRNLLSCTEWATLDVRLKYDAWVTQQLLDQISGRSVHSVADRPRHYCFPIGCFHNPQSWARDPWSHVPPEVMRDARAGRVLLIFDQSQEGNADPNLWSWFYAAAAAQQINPCRIVYMTSDHLAEYSHNSYCDINGIDNKMHVLSTMFNLHVITDMLLKRCAVPCDYDTWLSAKDDHTALYNCLNRVLHPHRRWLFIKLLAQGLIDRGLVSMDMFDSVPPLPDGSVLDTALLRQVSLPLTVDKSDFTVNHFNDLNPDIYLRSWFSVITETYVDDGQLLIGEKVFKPMLCSSPFMVLSSRGTLQRLRELGFQTFPMLWDESYDLMDVAARIDAIVAQITKLSQIQDLPAWFARAEPALRHNHRLAWQLWEDSRDYQRLIAIWQDLVA